MPENILDKALRLAKERRGHTTKAEAKPEEKTGHSYSMSCPGCNAKITFADEDLELWRTDDETSSTSGDTDESLDGDGDDDDGSEELDSDAKSKLVARIIARKSKR